MMARVRKDLRRGVVAGLVALGMIGLGGCGPASPFDIDGFTGIEGEVKEERECVDLWTFVHIGAGFYLGERLGEDGLGDSLALIVGYELLEPVFWPGFGENELNQKCDVYAGALGWLGWFVTEGD